MARMLRTRNALRLLGPADLDEVTALAALDPVVNVFCDFRARATRLEKRMLGGEFWGYVDEGRLVSACHAAANLVPMQATPAALDRFAERALSLGRRCATIVGPMPDVTGLWRRLEPRWGREVRELRWRQPHLEIAGPPLVEPDPLVRIATYDDVPALYPACVAMHTEELGVSPEAGGGADLYRARLYQLIERKWSFVRFEDDANRTVVFKAEIASATPYACQIQGVWVHPDHRNRGLASASMAAVADYARLHVAPVVSLYVNEHNAPARRVYEKVGFVQTAEFGTVLF